MVDGVAYIEFSKLKKGKLTFDITGYKVSIPLEDIVDEVRIIKSTKYASLQVYVISVGDDNNYQGGIPNCAYKYMYTVYDLENNQILMAPYAKLSGDRAVADGCKILSSCDHHEERVYQHLPVVVYR